MAYQVLYLYTMIIRFNVPDDKVSIVIDALCQVYGYEETLPNGQTNPQTKADFAKQCIVQFMQDAVRRAKKVEHQANLETVIEADVSGTNITAL